MKISDRLKKNLGLLLAVLLISLVLQFWWPVRAQLGVDSRVSRLESEISLLRAQVSQLQSQIVRLGNRSASPDSPRIENPEPASIPPFSVPKSMFDRLATLVIELKERMDKIDARVSALEGR